MVTLDDNVRQFLEEKRFAVLATLNRDGSIQQTVMWYQVRGDEIVMNTARGRHKDHNLLRDPRASICIEDEYRFVTITGNVEVIDDQATTQADIRALAERYHGPARAAEMMRDGFGKQERITLLLPIDHVIARGFDNGEG